MPSRPVHERLRWFTHNYAIPDQLQEPQSRALLHEPREQSAGSVRREQEKEDRDFFRKSPAMDIILIAEKRPRGDESNCA
ncbi:hypothetical protein O1611_g202 [Lasiodiplodia mahajangana]|uniref:Uncharacterized protein n=1 Tax=Lasiodiplodia mahajangana TaxID=1108764 RepID=A0ACC2K136_9PEZI|nr:hypothetical protein O1611_g202 [Lasiodiplodia mahajangana]